MPSSLELYRYKCLIGNKIFRGYSSLTLLQLNRRVLPGVGEMPIHNNFSFTFAKVTAVNWKELPQVKWRFRHYWLICWESASTVFPYKNSLSFSEFIFFFFYCIFCISQSWRIWFTGLMYQMSFHWFYRDVYFILCFRFRSTMTFGLKAFSLENFWVLGRVFFVIYFETCICFTSYCGLIFLSAPSGVQVLWFSVK